MVSPGVHGSWPPPSVVGVECAERAGGEPDQLGQAAFGQLRGQPVDALAEHLHGRAKLGQLSERYADDGNDLEGDDVGDRAVHVWPPFRVMSPEGQTGSDVVDATLSLAGDAVVDLALERVELGLVRIQLSLELGHAPAQPAV